MRRLVFNIIIILTLMGCRHEQLHPVSISIAADTAIRQLPTSITIDTLALKIRKDSIQEEVNYYMERHNIQDEGYEQIAEMASHGITTLKMQRMQLFNIGNWKFAGKRGFGMERDYRGRIVIGCYEADSLIWGTRLDSLGTYVGGFADGMASGYGRYLAISGNYYDGLWKEDQRHGFGCSIAPDEPVKAGEWKNGKYRGERMNYTIERIYGIDISRYQHGKGRKKYPIHWNKLHINHLGTLSKKHISGIVNYPVSFVFIKSTEGVTIRNPYFTTDYHQARKHGIPVGAYHFLSCKTDGAAQARHFLRHTTFRHGDLPPVLDVEPSSKQIKAMGGVDVLFNQIRTWMRMVQTHIGVRPLLYVSQSFVNNYLSQAPDLKRDYMVWIARYGEFKPDVRLAIWQLCPDGRVNGIYGDVDLNVFNGYRKQFEEFLRQETIK